MVVQDGDSPAERVAFLYDGDNVVADVVNTAGALAVSRFYVTPFLDQNLFMTDFAADGAKVYCYSQDGLVSVRTLTDKAGEVVNKYDYTAFGEKWEAGTSEAVKQRYTYKGREENAVSALMNYRYRQYSSRSGRFVGRDPIGTRDGVNLYVYVVNSPVVHTDAFGLFGPVAHETMVKYVMEQMGVPRRVAEQIAKQNVASDSSITFLANPEAHALSYGFEWFPISENKRRLRTFQRWHEFVHNTKMRIIDKLSKNCCDCSVLEDLGRLSHAIQDSHYHAFNTWLGWHWNTFLPSSSVPVREESELDEYLLKDGNTRLKRLIDDPNTRHDPNAATRAIVGATAATQSLFQEIKNSVGAECWDKLMAACEDKLRNEEIARQKEENERRDLEQRVMQAYPEMGSSIPNMSNDQLRILTSYRSGM